MTSRKKHPSLKFSISPKKSADRIRLDTALQLTSTGQKAGQRREDLNCERIAHTYSLRCPRVPQIQIEKTIAFSYGNIPSATRLYQGNPTVPRLGRKPSSVLPVVMFDSSPSQSIVHERIERSPIPATSVDRRQRSSLRYLSGASVQTSTENQLLDLPKRRGSLLGHVSRTRCLSKTWRHRFPHYFLRW